MKLPHVPLPKSKKIRYGIYALAATGLIVGGGVSALTGSTPPRSKSLDLVSVQSSTDGNDETAQEAKDSSSVSSPTSASTESQQSEPSASATPTETPSTPPAGDSRGSNEPIPTPEPTPEPKPAPEFVVSTADCTSLQNSVVKNRERAATTPTNDPTYNMMQHIYTESVAKLQNYHDHSNHGCSTNV